MGGGERVAEEDRVEEEEEGDCRERPGIHSPPAQDGNPPRNWPGRESGGATRPIPGASARRFRCNSRARDCRMFDGWRA
jgi:hypothetical protein